jgi:hypothetical protein
VQELFAIQANEQGKGIALMSPIQDTGPYRDDRTILRKPDDPTTPDFPMSLRTKFGPSAPPPTPPRRRGIPGAVAVLLALICMALGGVLAYLLIYTHILGN